MTAVKLEWQLLRHKTSLRSNNGQELLTGYLQTKQPPTTQLKANKGPSVKRAAGSVRLLSTSHCLWSWGLLEPWQRPCSSRCSTQASCGFWSGLYGRRRSLGEVVLGPDHDLDAQVVGLRPHRDIDAGRHGQDLGLLEGSRPPWPSSCQSCRNLGYGPFF